ncbi:MAG: 3-oxoacyl-ACP synthase III [Proteobacteria bacterium]|nr:MAG: 3-oxoacyl-ACP synthase III [Pseudomonadota bacterium]
MLVSKYSKVCLEAMAVNLPPIEVTSIELEDKIAPIYQGLGIPFGTLEKLSGIATRYFWEPGVMPSAAATKAAELALAKSSISKEKLGAIFNCSVARDYFEPATACLVHHNLGLPESAMALDLTNACIGFSNGITLLASLIESGTVQAGLLVSAETTGVMVESAVRHLMGHAEIDRESLLRIMPSFTIGSGAVAFILCHSDLAKGPRIIGSVSATASEHNDLCSGNGDFHMNAHNRESCVMYTESAKLMASACKLGARVMKNFSAAFGWSNSEIDHIFCHQVGKQVNDAFYREMNLDISKEYTIYKKYGNLVSAALPAALAIGADEKPLKRGDRVLLTAYGSGLNSIFTGIEW